MSFIEVSGVSKSFPDKVSRRHVLQNVSLSVEQGEFVAIVGAMGSGKSTLLSLLAGLISPDAGIILIDGQKVNGIRHDTAFVFQNYSLLPWLTALDNVRLAVAAAFPELSRAQQGDRAQKTLERMGVKSARDLAHPDVKPLLAAAVQLASVPLPAAGQGRLIIKSEASKKPPRRKPKK